MRTFQCSALKLAFVANGYQDPDYKKRMSSTPQSLQLVACSPSEGRFRSICKKVNQPGTNGSKFGFVKESEQTQTFEMWLGQYKALIFKIVRGYTSVPEDQQDLFQEIIVQVWKSIPLFKGNSAVTTWIYRIALNTAIKWIRKERRKDEIQKASAIEQGIIEAISNEDDRLSWLYNEIHKLDEIDRSVTLLMLDGLSYKEMSLILGITETHVGVKINRIKKQLINRSKNYDYGA